MKRCASLLLSLALLLSMLPVALADSREATASADALHTLGLFSGTGTNPDGSPKYDLDRAPTRSEAITMLLALLGKSAEARAGAFTSPFTDLADWARPYVCYAYTKQLTAGLSPSRFGADDPVTAAQYLTFVLRALGYETGVDFQWDSAWTLTDKLGITQGSYPGSGTFLRGDVAAVSFAALAAPMKGSTETLAQKLIREGVFTQLRYDTVRKEAASSSDSQPLSATEISQKCSPAVFYVDIFGRNGAPAGVASGFFISSDGLAVTNYHVAANSSALFLTTPDGKTYSDVQVIDFDEANDLALLKVAGSGFPCLELGNSDTLIQGQQVYAIGSPNGLDNTMSQGIISNPKRFLNGQQYVQISVPISQGSSGGALLDAFGRVVGVTSAGFTQISGDLNLAIPINFVKALDRGSDTSYTLWSETFYPGFSQAYDFGAFSNAELVDELVLPLGGLYQYDLSDFYSVPGGPSDEDCFLDTIYWFLQALKYSGFTETTRLSDTSSIYETETEILTFAVESDPVPAIYVAAELKPVFYQAVPTLLDLGWYLGLEGTGPEQVEDSLMYSYRWNRDYSSSELSYWLDLYFDYLESTGFVCSYSDYDSILYEGNDLSAAFILDNQRIYVDIS